MAVVPDDVTLVNTAYTYFTRWRWVIHTLTMLNVLGLVFIVLYNFPIIVMHKTVPN